jgi:hypothetical protein
MTPIDTDQVLSAVRLGWYLAEVRGRNRLHGPTPDESSLPSRDDHELPLRFERTLEESRIEAQVVLVALAQKLGVDKGPDDPSVDVTKVDDAAERLKASGATADWELLAELLFKLDSYIQDNLTAHSDTQACGYQLGRGLSEAYWALDIEPPDQDDDKPPSAGWTFLLGKARCDELSRFAGRLSAYFPAYTGPAVAGSLIAWSEVAADPVWRKVEDARASLYGQMRRWYGLIVLLQDPSTLIRPYAAVRNLGALWRAAKALWVQLLLASGSLVALAFFIAFLSSSHKSEFMKALLGVLSAIGISSATITTRLKNSSQALLTRAKDDVYTDLVAIEIAIIPARPGRLTGRQRSDIRVRRAVRKRRITLETR